MSYTSGITRFFTIGITSSGSRSIATRCWKARCGSGYERLSGRCAENWASRSYPAFCRENMSICSWKSRRILPSATSCGASRDGHRIGCRWSSRTCASATGGGISGLGLLLHNERQHHGRCHTSVSSGARTYRRQPVVIQFPSNAGYDKSQSVSRDSRPAMDRRRRVGTLAQDSGRRISPGGFRSGTDQNLIGEGGHDETALKVVARHKALERGARGPGHCHKDHAAAIHAVHRGRDWSSAR